jgi:hypothetical protein
LKLEPLPPMVRYAVPVAATEVMPDSPKKVSSGEPSMSTGLGRVAITASTGAVKG